jgi:type VI secretion system protein ImpH
MAGEDWGTSPDLKKLDLKLSLLKEGPSFSFFQAIRLLRHYISTEDKQDTPEYSGFSHIRISPLLSLAFPPADIDKIEEIRDVTTSHYSITANFFGLYGVSSPLPTFYTEDLMDEVNDDARATKDFIDIIHQRLYYLLYRGWMKYRQFQQVSEEQNTDHITRLFCLLGLGEPGFRQGIENVEQLLRYIGLFSQSPRSALGLKTLLQDQLHLPVDILPCVPRKAKIPVDQQIQLGSRNAGLGLDSFLGEEMDDRMGKFRILVGPLDEQEYRAFIPGSTMYKKLVFLADLFVLDPLEYDIDVTMAHSQAQTICLGGSRWASLGRDTWLFSGETMGKTTSRFYPAHEKTN